MTNNLRPTTNNLRLMTKYFIAPSILSADFGNRSRFETDLLETMVLVSGIRYARKNVKW